MDEAQKKEFFYCLSEEKQDSPEFPLANKWEHKPRSCHFETALEAVEKMEKKLLH